MSRITRNPRITAWIGSTCALALCTIWLLDANAEDRRKTIPDKKSARTRPANSNVRAGARAGAGTITVSGFRVKLMRQVLLGFDRVGTIADLNLHEGKRVKAGEVIAKLDDEVAVAALNSARKKASNDVHKRYATASYAVSKNEHQQALLANKNAGMDVVPKIEITRLLLAEQRSQLQIEQAVHDQAVADLDSTLAEAQLNTYRLKAPFDGIVADVLAWAGDDVAQDDVTVAILRVKA